MHHSTIFHFIFPVFQKKISSPIKLEVTEKIFKKIVRIPLHSSLNLRSAKYISDHIKKFFKKFNDR